jgi:hypothetical protein
MVKNITAIALTVLLITAGVSGCSNSNQASTPSICTKYQDLIHLIEQDASTDEYPDGILVSGLASQLIDDNSLGYGIHDFDTSNGLHTDITKTFMATSIVFAPCLSSTAQNWLSAHE